jgi:hypothetical protein
MTPRTHRFCAAAFTFLLGAGAFVSPSSAQQRAQVRTPAEVEGTSVVDAETTRHALMEVLDRHPPSVGRVMKLDPSLMRNEGYLASYPALREFLAKHPEIQQNSEYYLQQVQGFNDWQPRNRQLELIEGVLAGVAGFIAFSVVLSTLVWLIRTVLDQRRWNRLSKIQAEVHTKLMDRFSTNDELLTYVQTPPGRRFLESGPSPLQEFSPAMTAPISRIMWSVQLGAVMVVSGIGLLVLSSRAVPETRDFFYIAGWMLGALGAGFLVSAIAAYGLSRRLGLLDRHVASNA